jgi:hypothetical protein
MSETMKTISMDSIIKIMDNVVSCDLDGEVAILNMNDGIYYGLDPIGARIWDLIQNPIALGNILEIILEEYDVKYDQCKEDVLELIEKFHKNGLVKINDNFK